MAIPVEGEGKDMTQGTTTEDGKPLALRARKQRRARLQAMEVASRIFRERGFDQATLEEIADQADMSVSSLLRYFGSKEQLALAHHIDHLESCRLHLADDSKPVVERWRKFIVDQAMSLRSFDSYNEERRLIVSVPGLLRLLSRIQLDQQDDLAKAFAAEAGVDPDEDLYGRLLAALLVAGNEAVYIQWLRSGGQGDLAEMCLAVVDFVAMRLGSRADTAAQVPSLFRARPPAPQAKARSRRS
ncbi:MAG: TetR family transcriptional regulator [Rhizobiales bacterium]|jgi:AcrR family transcriptional regulator|nr:TetR family transcriptional regulator [Hyphomicrobiales bacterium]